MTARDDGRAAAHALFRTGALPADSINAIADRVMNAYAPGHREEVLAEAAPPCAACETPIEWVACPTGGWWAHHAHPAGGHDAQPPGVATRDDGLREAAAALQARIDRNAPYKAESQSYVALCGAREIVLGLLGDATATPETEQS